MFETFKFYARFALLWAIRRYENSKLPPTPSEEDPAPPPPPAAVVTAPYVPVVIPQPVSVKPVIVPIKDPSPSTYDHTVLISLPAATDLDRLLPQIPALGDELAKFFKQLSSALHACVNTTKNTDKPTNLIVHIYQPKE